MSVLSTRGGRSVSFGLSPDEIEQIKRLWLGAPELSAREIGLLFGVTKNVVIGHRYRKGWKMRRPGTKEPSTLAERCDALDVFPPSGCCVYPIGHPGKDGFRLCGQTVPEVGMPYCLTHAAVCMVSEASKRQIAAWEDDEERRLAAAARLKKLGNKRRAAA